MEILTGMDCLIFFAANQSGSRLYINKGNMQFEDITRKGVTTSSCTGNVVDINNDGWPDIRLCIRSSG